MSPHHGRFEQVDLERTDRLPVVVGGAVDPDVMDDAEPMEVTATYAVLPAAADAVQRQDATIAELQQSLSERDSRLSVLQQKNADLSTLLVAQAAELRRSAETVGLKSSEVEVLTEDNRALRSALVSAKNALEERDFLIRRLERSEGVAAHAPGRLSGGPERSGGAPSVAERSAELIGPNGETYVLGRRTRIGRAPGCDVQLDYSSVSRHHAQVSTGPRDVVVEDLNSTNGVIVNGRKISRQLLNDGDLVVIGEVALRLALREVPGGLQPAAGDVPVS